MAISYKSPLHQTVATTKTDFWNDSCALDELTYAIENGAVGATTNPVIIRDVLKQEMNIWKGRIHELIRDMADSNEEDIAWRLNEEMAVRGAGLLKPIFEREQGRKGRISIQTNPKYYRDWKGMVEQARHFSGLAPNIQVKMPVTEAGLKAIEESTFEGINITATVCFSVSQAVAVAEAMERGLVRRQVQGLMSDELYPICAIMVGRLDDWLKVVMEKENIIADPACLEWAGVAVFKRAYEIFQEKKYTCRLLSAAYRNHFHWSEFIGGDVVLTIPYKWQKRFNSSDVEVRERISIPVDSGIMGELSRKFHDFNRAYEPKGMVPGEFAAFGSTARTMRSFIQGYEDLLKMIRDFMIPNPDL